MIPMSDNEKRIKREQNNQRQRERRIEREEKAYASKTCLRCFKSPLAEYSVRYCDKCLTYHRAHNEHYRRAQGIPTRKEFLLRKNSHA